MTDEPENDPEVDIETFAEAHAAGAAVLDVRRVEEYTDRHVPGAVLIPLDQLGERVDDVPAADPLYVICKSGGRSAAAVRALNQAGFNTINVAGGTDAWATSGRPVNAGMDP